MKSIQQVSPSTRKALAVQVGEDAATELSSLVNELFSQVAELKRTKVSVTSVVPMSNISDDDLEQALGCRPAIRPR